MQGVCEARRHTLPTASWSEGRHSSEPDFEGDTIPFCDTIFTAVNLDPAKAYSAHLVVHSINGSQANAVDTVFGLPVSAGGVGTLSISWEECGSIPLSAYGEVLDANGAVIAKAGPVKLFLLS
jgi:hypothetical protein